MATHFSILAWRIQGKRSLLGYSPWGPKESDTTEQFSLLVQETSECYLIYSFVESENKYFLKDVRFLMFILSFLCPNMIVNRYWVLR